ncbi:GNAT family N-acetyltransferase [Streptomyces albogriseolus]|uniref:GNAT family N-acetyltransferase n=1 Tax=Streptomyces albogriseolus TaxID=1887 RepID=UPI0037AE00DF
MASSHPRARLRPPPALHGHGLFLRPWDPESPADAETWLRGTADPEFRRWNTPLRPVTGLAAARESLRVRAAQTADGTGVSFHVSDADSGTALGHIGVTEIRPALRCGRVGHWVLPEARGRGVATRALLLTAEWALTAGGLHRLELGHVVGHTASCHIADRCGFFAEGTLRDAVLAADRRDAYRDAHLHARLSTDPMPPAP